jgi:parallel beta-helix repeat protein
LIQDAPANLVGGLTAGAGNVVSGNDRIGVSITGASAVGNVIQGNILGLDVNGNNLISNTFSGVSVEDSPGTVIGGITAGARNVISGNGTNGIFITAAAAGIGGSSVIQGNYIGLDITGELPRGNGDNGILIIVASNNTIGGAAAGAGNVISSNVNIQANEGGLSISQSHNNVVQGNLIGLDKDGTTNLGNGSNGIILGTGSTNNVIGGASAGAGNTIAGNGFGPAGPGAGILLIDFGGPVATANNAILGNRIGTTLDGTTAIGNMLGGVVVFDGPTNNVIGGPLPGQGNLISGSVGVGGVTPFGDGVILRNASGNQVFGNRIGTNAAGTAARANVGSGVLLDNADNSLIQGNLISGNGQDGVSVTNGSDGNVIRGNLVGTDVTGASDLGNTRDGVRIDASLNNIVGGTETGQGNVLSGNGAMGLLIDGQTGAATGNVVQGNIIGLASNGLAAIGNDLLGVDILSASGNTVGGTTAGARNVISSNHAGGVFVGLPLGVLVGSASNNTIQGNYIGLDVSGAVPRGNEQEGIVVSNGANNVIRDNIIANNLATGIAVAGPLATGNTIQGNAIGTAADRTTPHGNFGDGVHFDLNASNNLVGGTTAGTGNLIAFNSNAGFSGGNGVAVLSGNRNSILGNSIFDNALMGIALSPGANDNQAAPVLTSAVIAGGQVTVTGTVGGVAGHVFRIEIFGNAAGGNEGQTFLGFVEATANGAGVASFAVTLPLPAGLTVITATATDQTTDSTSAFSPGTPVTQPVPPTPPAPVPVVYFAATGTGRQSSVVTIFDARTGQVVFSFRPYGPRFRGRVRVAVGDVNGDGVPDIVVGPGPGANRPVLVFDGRNLALLFRFAVGGRRQIGGVTLAVGDLNRDGKGDIVVGTGPGSPGGVVAFSGLDGRVLLSALPFGRRYLRGVRVAVADVNGDGLSEVLAEGTISGRPVVRIVG